MTRAEEILEFWFHAITDKTPINKDLSPFNMWFAKNAKVDFEICEKFEGDLNLAKMGKYKKWEETSEGRLALIVLFDQFSRNIYRGSAKAFEADPLALDVALRSIKEGVDRELQLIERVFLYMPLMHAEDLEMQKLSVQQFENLVGESKDKNPQNSSYFEYTLKFAKEHCAAIERFGHFPSRNAISNREN